MNKIKSSDLTEKDKKRFWDKVGPQDKNGCREWTASKDKDGYGRFKVKGKSHRAHRIAYVLANGSILPGVLVCHKCDNSSCVEDGHFFLGTDKDNRRDAARKGRVAIGVMHGSCKVTKLDALEMRKRYSEGETKTSIAEDFIVSRVQVGKIVNRKNWAHV